MEVMGLMLGEFVDDYTVRVVDVFAMPQSGTGVSVEAVDPVFQTKMMDMLRQTGRYVKSVTSFPRSLANMIASDPRPSLAGTTHIPVSAAGFRASISTPNNPSNNSHLALSPSSLTRSSPSRARSSLTPSASSTLRLSCSDKSPDKPHQTSDISTSPQSRPSFMA